MITEETNWKTQYIVTSQILRSVVDHLHCMGQEDPFTNADSAESISIKPFVLVWQQTFLQTLLEKLKAKPMTELIVFLKSYQLIQSILQNILKYWAKLPPKLDHL